MEHKASDFIVNSNGHCFLCLDKISSQFPPFQEEISKHVPSTFVYSLQYLSRYLKMDMQKVFIDEGPIPEELRSKVKKSRLKVELCDECSRMTAHISKLCRQLEKLEMEIASGMVSVHEKFLEAERTHKIEHLRSDGDTGFKSGMGGRMDVLEILRLEAMQKCACKLNNTSPSPRPRIQNLTNNQIKGLASKIALNKKGHDDNEATPRSKSSWQRSSIKIEQPPTPDWALEDDQSQNSFMDDDMADCLEDSYAAIVKDEVVTAQKTGKMTTSSKAIKQGNLTAKKESPFIIVPSKKIRNKPNWIMNPGTNKYKCRLCSMEFMSIAGFHYHYNRIHGNIRYRCRICGKKFSDSSNYKVHHRSAHMGLKFECQVCKTVFSQKSNLRRHQKNFGCDNK